MCLVCSKEKTKMLRQIQNQLSFQNIEKENLENEKIYMGLCVFLSRRIKRMSLAESVSIAISRGMCLVGFAMCEKSRPKFHLDFTNSY